MNHFRIALIQVLLVFLVGCHHSNPPTLPPNLMNGHYIDLQPGWRLKVVVPILESGAYKVKTEESVSSGGTVNMHAEDGFKGYETDLYSVNAASDGQSVIALQSAEFTAINQKKEKREKAVVSLFDLPPSVAYVRLLFLTRASEEEHDEAILGASSSSVLEELTQKVEDNSERNCASSQWSHCSWVPAGIAVQVERRDPSKRNAWVPAL
jgi:hypothetical protein